MRCGNFFRSNLLLVLVTCVSSALGTSVLLGTRVETLPAPVINGNSFEVLINSRYSVHSGFEEDLPVQVLANVLWAMSRVPYSGDYREFYVATPENVYRYEPASRTLRLHLAGDHRYNSGSAFEIGVATPRQEDAGMAIQAGLLAGISFWSDTGEVVCCPMKWAADFANNNWRPAQQIKMVNVFGRAPARGLDTTVVAFSSDSSLPLPITNSTDTFEVVLWNLKQDSVFTGASLSLETVSQLLWAGYGVTPHFTINGRQGLTVPSALAGYFLTGRIYLVTGEGIDRYWNRLPGGGLNTRDHRLERMVTGDWRIALRNASSRIPGTAPVYIVVCVDDTVTYQTLQEAGFVAFNLLMQARALGLSAYLTLPLSIAERVAIKSALFLPDDHHPVLVFSCGEGATGVRERRLREGVVQIVRAQPAVRKGSFRLEYRLRQSGLVRIEVFDLLGRPVKTLLEARQSTGYHSIVWDGTDARGNPVRRGSYLINITVNGEIAQHKVTWSK